MKKSDVIVEKIMSRQDKCDRENDLGMFYPGEANRWCKNKDSMVWLEERIGDEEIEILNPVNEYLSNKSKETGEHPSGVGDSVLSSMRNYLFEMDDEPISGQLQYIEELKDKVINRSVFSGSKSYHNRITINSPEIISKEEYHYIWNCLNKLFFNGKADTQCKNPSRRTRVPNAWRKDKKTDQTVVVNNKNILYCYNFFHEKFLRKEKDQQIENRRMRYIMLNKRCREGKDPNVKVSVAENEKVQYYLTKSFGKMTGNGDSNKSLYTAICVCVTAGDENTLDLVLSKARAEKWSQGDLDKKLKEARKYCNK